MGPSGGCTAHQGAQQFAKFGRAGQGRAGEAGRRAWLRAAGQAVGASPLNRRTQQLAEASLSCLLSRNNLTLSLPSFHPANSRAPPWRHCWRSTPQMCCARCRRAGCRKWPSSKWRCASASIWLFMEVNRHCNSGFVGWKFKGGGHSACILLARVGEEQGRGCRGVPAALPRHLVPPPSKRAASCWNAQHPAQHRNSCCMVPQDKLVLSKIGDDSIVTMVRSRLTWLTLFCSCLRFATLRHPLLTSHAFGEPASCRRHLMSSAPHSCSGLRPARHRFRGGLAPGAGGAGRHANRWAGWAANLAVNLLSSHSNRISPLPSMA